MVRDNPECWYEGKAPNGSKERNPKSSIVSTAANNEASGFMILMAGIRSSKNLQPYDLVAFTKLMYKMASEE